MWPRSAVAGPRPRRRGPPSGVAARTTLLDWLDVRMRHRVDSDGLQGLVLLDLPDFDSVETAHRLEVDRIVELADALLWVVEPQKYADAALHDRYLRPRRTHADAMALLLNQADLLSASEVAAVRDDATRLLGEDGLRDTPVLVISALTGVGLEELRSLLGERVAARDAAVARLAADVEAAARRCSSGAVTRSRRACRRRSGSGSSRHCRRRPACRASWRPWGRRTAAGARLPPGGLSCVGCGA